MEPSLQEQERLLLAQQRRGHSHLRFSQRLEQAFSRDRFRVMQRHWGIPLVIVSAVSFQLVYALHDLLVMPLPVGLSLLPLRLISVLVVIASCWYFRRPQSDPRLAYLFFAGSYLVCGICLVLMIYYSRHQGQSMPYEGLLLLLLFGYSLVGLPFRTALLSGWLLYLLFLALGLRYNANSVELAYQLLFMGCVNLIGSTGSYIQEHAHRSAWINLRLLRIARHRAESDTQGKLRLLAVVSHDLRQPLNAMGLYAQHLQECASDPEVQRISERLNLSVEQLSRMLQSLLDYNRLSLPGMQVHLQSVALGPLLGRLRAEAAPEADKQGTLLSLRSDDLWIRSDPLLLERLLRNLLNNALRHAEAEHVWLHARQVGEEVLLEVGDDGRGLTMEEQERAFEEFQQLRNPSGNGEQGLGLGLAIVRQLAALLAHPLQLQSSPGQGACFRLRLPLAPALTTETAPCPRVLSGRILLLEDHRPSREALQALLRRWGCEVWACADYDAAAACLAEADPQMLISDYRLGEERDGLDALEQLRAQAGRMVPALLVSADIGPELQARCSLLNVGLLGKPLLPARLRQALGMLLPTSNEPLKTEAIES